jgi:hypothetical protein
MVFIGAVLEAWFPTYKLARLACHHPTATLDHLVRLVQVVRRELATKS